MTWPAGTKLEFLVLALEPVAKGNHVAFMPKHGKRPIITDRRTPELKQWETCLRQAADAELDRCGLIQLRDTPCEVHLVLWLVRPRGQFDRRGPRPSAPAFPLVKPDIDKLQRTIFDALTGCVIDDDARICRVVVEKRYVENAARAGVAVRVIAMPATIREAKQP